MVEIRNLEFTFEVEGEGDEVAFARLFDKYIKRWHRMEAEARERQQRLEAERALIDRRREENER
jgi:hypothetical protein